jgi:DNA processing protein
VDVKFAIDDPGYPERLRALPNPPRVLSSTAPLEAQARVVAIVGSRRAADASLTFAYDLAFELAKAGIVVISGGAVGIDAAAHRGAMAAGGATWVVCPTGRNHVYPPQNRKLFEDIGASSQGRVLWPFPDAQARTSDSFLYRNGILAALSETLVVVQARLQSGSRNAVAWARALDRPVWAMTAAPWMDEFRGSTTEIEQGRARPLCSARQLLRELGVRVPVRELTHRTAREDNLIQAEAPLKRALVRIPKPPQKAPPNASWTPEEKALFSVLCTTPRHIDQIVAEAGLSIPPAATALLTLALKNVVVEGPNGFYRRKSAS